MTAPLQGLRVLELGHAEALQHARPKVLDHHVTGRGQLSDDGEASFGLAIDADRSFIPSCDAPPDSLAGALWPHRSQTVADAGAFNFDDVHVVAGSIYTADDIVVDPHIEARDNLVEVADGENEVRMPGVVPRLTGIREESCGPAPTSECIPTEYSLAFSDCAAVELGNFAPTA